MNPLRAHDYCQIVRGCAGNQINEPDDLCKFLPPLWRVSIKKKPTMDKMMFEIGTVEIRVFDVVADWHAREVLLTLSCNNYCRLLGPY